MSRTDILEDIKKAETEAAATIDKAEADKKSKISEARRMSVQKIQDAEAQARSNFDSSMAKAKDDLSSERDTLLSAGKKEAAELDESSAAKLNEVKKFLNDEFERTIDVTS